MCTVDVTMCKPVYANPTNCGWQCGIFNSSENRRVRVIPVSDLFLLLCSFRHQTPVILEPVHTP